MSTIPTAAAASRRIPFVLPLGLAHGCGSDGPGVTEPDVPEPPGQTLADAGNFETVQDAMQESAPEEFETTSGRIQYFCTRWRVSLTRGFSDYPQFDPNTQVVFPGNLLQGNTLDFATPSGIPLQRGPGTIVISLVNGASSATRVSTGWGSAPCTTR